MNSKQKTGYSDKFGNDIFEHNRTRSWQYDPVVEKKGFWLYEEVKLYQNDWYLFEIGFDHEKQNDPPKLLKDHHLEVEVIGFFSIINN